MGMLRALGLPALVWDIPEGLKGCLRKMVFGERKKLNGDMMLL